MDKEKKEARKLGIDLDQETARGIDQYMHSTADEKVRKKDAKVSYNQLSLCIIFIPGFSCKRSTTRNC